MASNRICRIVPYLEALCIVLLLRACLFSRWKSPLITTFLVPLACRSPWAVGTRGWNSPTPLCNLASHRYRHPVSGPSCRSLGMRSLTSAYSNLLVWNTNSLSLVAVAPLPTTQSIFRPPFMYCTSDCCSGTESLNVFADTVLSASDCLAMIDRRVRENDRKTCVYQVERFDLKYYYGYRYRSFFLLKSNR